MKIVLGIAVLLIIVGMAGGMFFGNSYRTNTGTYRTDKSFRTGHMGGGMMNDNYSTYRSASDEIIELEKLEDKVNDYIKQYDEKLQISDIFVFDDTDYYFSIIEADTGFGAMELLVNQYSGEVYPEFGPNMMWNLKYGMHGNSGYGMMGRRGMMGGNSYRNDNSSEISDFNGNDITVEEAQKFVSDYLKDQSYTVSEDGHEFYGYYTFHIEEGEKTVGMLSVNGSSGEVWYHDWHGTVSEIIGGHESDEDHS